MTHIPHPFGQRTLARALAVTLATALVCTSALAQTGRVASRTGDFIVAVVNTELVTSVELQQRLDRIQADAQREGARLPDAAALRQQVLDALIDERVQITHARDSGQRVDEGDIDRAIANIAAQNQLTIAQLRDRLRADGMDVPRFRSNLRDQIMVERVREREVNQRIRITDADIDSFIEKQRGSSAGEVQYNIAQILIKLPDNPTDSVVAERRARADQAVARVRAGEDFATVARQLSEDNNRERGGEIGLLPADRLPDIFLETVRPLKEGEVAPTLLRTGAGFHLLKLVERSEGGALRVTQTRARHILLRPSEQLPEAAVQQRLADFKRQIIAGTRRFEDLAREHSLDGSASQGGDLGWASPGQFVPEFEAGMNPLPLGGVSDPVTTRFGVHLIQVMERRVVAPDTKQLRDQARAALRERKFDEAYVDWLREVRGRAYVEFREAPQ
jgi:peptidyl-prolyl cis-trans isomerase SurA